MNPRKTSTGTVLEQMVVPALVHGGYKVRKQVLVGKRPGGRRHVADVVAEDANGRRFLVSRKWQQVGGTAEQKVPFEVISLLKVLKEAGSSYERAYLVLGGPGWTLRGFFTSGEMEEFIAYRDFVKVVDLETFIMLANQGTL